MAPDKVRELYSECCRRNQEALQHMEKRCAANKRWETARLYNEAAEALKKDAKELVYEARLAGVLLCLV